MSFYPLGHQRGPPSSSNEPGARAITCSGCGLGSYPVAWQSRTYRRCGGIGQRNFPSKLTSPAQPRARPTYGGRVRLDKGGYARGGLAAGLLLAGLVIAAIVFRHSLNWGDVPTWILAFATMSAFAAAGAAAIIAYRLLQVELKRDKEAAADRALAAEDRRLAEQDRLRAEEERSERRAADRQAQVIADEERAARRADDRRAQAEKVAAWFAVDPRKRDGYGNADWGAVIKNASDLPIIDVRPAFYLVEDNRPGQQWVPVFRGSPVSRVLVIPPGTQKFVGIPEDVWTTYHTVSDDVYVVAIEFTDTAGNRWKRDPRGALEDLTGSA
jgi:hypothetical protein